MNSSKLNWSFEKPTEEGLYLCCLGDVETEANIQPLRMVHAGAEHMGQYPWPTYNIDLIKTWHSSFKFTKLFSDNKAET